LFFIVFFCFQLLTVQAKIPWNPCGNFRKRLLFNPWFYHLSSLRQQRKNAGRAFILGPAMVPVASLIQWINRTNGRRKNYPICRAQTCRPRQFRR
jgi:hypothetical protein